ncbi:hypothetical protein V5O48_010096 [Marasmius crinis-equi]|uniref:CxC1-like cysteine cluster associated with KDZ transposases domain-containing protein n=1 Tax=Marasmius crinis-equi TaxID=585013 RepID=A0ABR3F9A9_9AGAR
MAPFKSGRKAAGLSKKVNKGYGKSGMSVGVDMQHINIAKTQEQVEFDSEKFKAMCTSLDFDGRAHFSTDHNDIPLHDSDDDYEDYDYPMASAPPPGQEGIMHSNEGNQMYEDIVNRLLTHSHRRADDRTRRDRTEKQTESWARQHDRLVDAYLAWREYGPPLRERQLSELNHIDTYSIHGYIPSVFSHTRDSRSINESLVLCGYLGGAPEQPTVAFELLTLEIYRQLHRVCPSLSIDAFARALQHISGQPRQVHLEDQLRIAYDQFLAMQRDIDKRCNKALGRDTDEYLVQNICPPCTYELKNEISKLFPRILLSIDGGNSLKMVDSEHKRGEARIDTRNLSDPRWLEPEEVDIFKNEVQNAQRARRGQTTDIAYLNVNETEELKSCIDTCVERWKAAAPEGQKRMFSFFAITGIFIAVCRHGHLYVVCDMRKSGELMKYPLAIVNKLLERYGEDLGLGYDIMCAFYKTMQQSQKLGSMVAVLHLHGVVPAFHGHAHNRKCQLSWHPMYIPGVGMTDFEECERFFSLSNRLAITTRLATPFHRRQAILEHFNFHSEDKDAGFGHFVYNQYREALRRLAGLVPLFRKHCKELQITPEYCEQLLNEEREHFMQDVTEDPELTMRLDYAELLTKHWADLILSDDAAAKYNTMNRAGGIGYSRAEQNTIRARRTAAFARWKASGEQVSFFEIDNAIGTRWSQNGPEYRAALSAMTGRKYRRALEKLERLVVQRLLEITKLNMSGTGYKQRTKISQALTSRAEAIRKAITEYNNAADLLTPPREHIDWAQIIQMVSLADFDLLKLPDLNIGGLTWAQERYREVMHEHFQILRAREEIIRLNVEIKRKVTYMLDTHADYVWAERRAITNGDSSLAVELHRRREILSRINTDIATRLLETSQLQGFTGDLRPGERIGRDPGITDKVPLPMWATSILHLCRVSDGFENSPGDTTPHQNSSSDNETHSDSHSDLDSDSDIGENSDDRADRAERLISLFESWSVL